MSTQEQEEEVLIKHSVDQDAADQEACPVSEDAVQKNWKETESHEEEDQGERQDDCTDEKAPMLGGDSAADRAVRERQAFMYTLRCSIVASLGSLLLGYDIGVVSGIIPYIQEEFSLTDNEIECFTALLALVAAIGALFGGPIADRYGRRMPMIIAGFLFAIGAVLIGLAQGFAMMIGGRLLHGIAVGLKLMISPVYIAEITAPQYRGALVSSSEICINVGILLAFGCNALLPLMDKKVGWRMLFLGSTLPAIVLVLALICMPESPRWLAVKQRTEEAKEVLKRCSASDQEAEEMFEEIDRSIKAAGHKEIGLSWDEFMALWKQRIFVIGMAIASLQQLSGIESFVLYVPTILTRQNLATHHEAVLITVALGVVKLLASLVGAWLADVWGRRPGSIYGYAGMGVGLTVLAVGIGVKTQAAEPLIYIGMFAYMSFFGAAAGPLCWLLLAEIFPLHYRSVGIAFGTAFNRLASAVVAFTFLSLSSLITPAGVFSVYAMMCFIAAAFYYLCVTETRGKTLEQIEAELSPPRKEP